jgi:hypothetical protein
VRAAKSVALPHALKGFVSGSREVTESRFILVLFRSGAVPLKDRAPRLFCRHSGAAARFEAIGVSAMFGKPTEENVVQLRKDCKAGPLFRLVRSPSQKGKACLQR